MIHRFEVDPPQTQVLIFADPGRAEAGMFEVDGYINARMIGGRNQLGEYLGPCLITVDDETTRGRWELEQIEARLAAGMLPGVRPYEPEQGVSDEQIEALVARRVLEELTKRGHTEQPSPDALAELFTEATETTPAGESTGLATAAVMPVSTEVLENPDGRKRCPIDGRWFAKQGWWQHWRYTTDAVHERLAPEILAKI